MSVPGQGVSFHWGHWEGNNRIWWLDFLDFDRLGQELDNQMNGQQILLIPQDRTERSKHYNFYWNWLCDSNSYHKDNLLPQKQIWINVFLIIFYQFLWEYFFSMYLHPLCTIFDEMKCLSFKFTLFICVYFWLKSLVIQRARQLLTKFSLCALLCALCGAWSLCLACLSEINWLNILGVRML